MPLLDLITGSFHSQEHRLLTLTTPRPEAGLLLDQFKGSEGVSHPFSFTLDLLSEQRDLVL